MKTIKLMLTGMALLLICIGAKANAKPIDDKPTMDDIVKTYVDAVANAKVANIDRIFANDLQFSTQRGDNTTTMTKDEVVNTLKSGAYADPSVTTKTIIEQGDDNLAVIKVEFKYPGYTRIDEVTLTNVNGWAISKVESTFAKG